MASGWLFLLAQLKILLLSPEKRQDKLDATKKHPACEDETANARKDKHVSQYPKLREIILGRQGLPASGHVNTQRFHQD